MYANHHYGLQHINLRKQVVEFVKEGGTKADAARRFRVSVWCVHEWCGRAGLAPKRHGPRRRKLDRLALRQHVAQHPDATLKERAQHFGGRINAIWYALRQMKVTHKKTLRYAERDPTKRGAYLQQLRHLLAPRGAAKVVYLDESGFERTAHRTYGWACKGQRIAGQRSRNTRPRTSLIAGKWGKRLVAPVLFEGSTNAEWFNAWLEQHLFKELAPHSTLIMDNAAFHKTKETQKLINQAGHTLLFLPPYSPDFNPIEQDFATIKKRRQYARPAGYPAR